VILGETTIADAENLISESQNQLEVVVGNISETEIARDAAAEDRDMA